MKKILIVDDDIRLLDMTRKLLEATGVYEVRTEDSARRAVAALPLLKPDLIVLDMNMPEMGGMEFLKQIATPGGKLRYPVLVLTARANMAAFFDDVAVAGLLAKPCEPDALRREVDRIVLLNHAAEMTQRQADAKRPARILIGEDEQDVGKRLTDACRQAGYEVDWAAAGPQVLERILVQRPDLILAKLILTGLNGDALARTLRDLPNIKDIPVILYDGDRHQVEEAKVASAGSGVQKFIRSAEPRALLSAVAEILAR